MNTEKTAPQLRQDFACIVNDVGDTALYPDLAFASIEEKWLVRDMLGYVHGSIDHAPATPTDERQMRQMARTARYLFELSKFSADSDAVQERALQLDERCNRPVR